MPQGSIVQIKPDGSLLLLDIICLKIPVKSYFITAIETNYELFKEEFFHLGFLFISKSKTDKICGFCHEIVSCLILRGAPLSSKTKYDGKS
ncbi:MAG: hypothetical protein K0R91_345 [Nitrososphaeraceae archaeon]|jgi:hypothetical protein|nr:hypothetical protein [Nitrososphaeraceae archaeon]